MAFYNGSKYTTLYAEGNGDWQIAIDENMNRRNLLIFCHTSAANDMKIDFSDTPDDNTSITLQEGAMWEPKVTPTNKVSFKAPLGDILVVYFK